MRLDRLAVIMLFSLLAACGQSAESKQEANRGNIHDEQQEDASVKNENQLGYKVYSAVCRICHGVDGSMGASGAANLTISQLSEEEAIAVITKGRNTMQAFENQLTEEEINAVAAYIQSFKGG